MEQMELVVVGGGQAGASAACEAARLGVKVTLFDENPVPPAWMRLQVPLFYGGRIPESLTSQQVYRWLEQKPLLREAVELGVDVRTQHAVWGCFPERTLGIYHGDRTWLAQAERIIFATGAGDIPLAFPGWTLPSVMGAAGAKALLEIYAYLPARRMLILGSGNLAMGLALQFRKAGIEIGGIVEVCSEVHGDPSLAAECVEAGMPFFLSHSLKEARGEIDVEDAVLLRVDEQTGAAVPDTERVVEVDSICIALGLAPNIELPYLSRCEIRYDSNLGGYFPLCDEDVQINQRGIFIAGKVAGVRDAPAAGEIDALEGRLAATGAVRSLGKLGAPEAERQGAQLWARLQELRNRYSDAEQYSGNYLEKWFQAAFSGYKSDFPICRCEEVAVSEVLAGLEYVGAQNPDEIKRVTRCGMGYCQGRGCRQLLAGLLARQTGRPISTLPVGSYRAPVRPIKLGALATDEVTDYDREMTVPSAVLMRSWFPE